MKKVKSLSIVLLLLIIPGLLKAQDKSSFDRGTYILKKDTLPYRILFPQDFDPTKKYPLILVLHGTGERGNNNESQLVYGTKTFLKDSIREKYAAIVVYPQCPENGWWANNKFEQDSITHKTKFVFQHDAPPTKAMVSLLGLLDQLLEKPNKKKQKKKKNGLSMGGLGTFDIFGCW